MPLLGELYQSVRAKGNAVFWWIGDEEYWSNVYCAFEDGKMIAKGQVGIINIVPPGRTQKNRHSIYINLKTIPGRENDTHLLDTVYSHLFTRAQQLKETLPKEYGTNLCVGNDSSETANNQFFVQKGFLPLHSLYQMKRDLLHEPIAELPLHEELLQFSHWKMESPSEESHYLDVESEIWPDMPLGLNRLKEHKQHRLWTSMVVRQAETIAGALMTWQEEDHGVIEEVFVREPWRKRGIAKFLLTQALQYLKANQMPYATLMVLTTNRSALSLYESVGFRVDQEEVRYYMHLD